MIADPSLPAQTPTDPDLTRPGRSRAARAMALLVAHTRTPLVDADGPVSDEQVIRSALAILRQQP